MSSKSIVVFFLPLCIFAQFLEPSIGISVKGEIRSARAAEVDRLSIDLRPMDSAAASDRATTDREGHFTFDNIAPGMYRLRVLTQPGGEVFYEQPVQVSPFTGSLIVELPSRAESRPISGVVSAQQLRRAPSKNALRAFTEAGQYSRSHDTERAIEKLELAIRLDPEFREAHLNLGAQYVRLGRFQEAMTHFQSTLEIGGPDPKAYSNLSFCYLKLDQYADAESFAQKALALDPANGPAQTILRALATRRN